MICGPDGTVLVWILLFGDCSVEGCVWIFRTHIFWFISPWENLYDWHSGIQQHKSFLSVLSLLLVPRHVPGSIIVFHNALLSCFVKCLRCVVHETHEGTGPTHTIGGFHDNPSFSAGGVWAVLVLSPPFHLSFYLLCILNFFLSLCLCRGYIVHSCVCVSAHVVRSFPPACASLDCQKCFLSGRKRAVRKTF